MKIRASVVSLRFIFPHPPEDEKKKKFAWITPPCLQVRDLGTCNTRTSSIRIKPNVQFHASPRVKEELQSSRDKYKGAYRSGDPGEGLSPSCGDPGSEFRLGREKEK